MPENNTARILPALLAADGRIDCQLVIFDLDGTLVDTGPGIKNSIRKAVAKLGLPPKTDEELNRFIGPPLRSAFRDVFALPPAETETALHCYRQFYYQAGIYEAELYGGIPDLVRELHEKGYVLSLGTSKPWVLAHRVLRHFGLRPYFDTVFGCYQDGRLDSKALVLKALLAHYSGRERQQPGRLPYGGSRDKDRGNAAAPVRDLAAPGSFRALMIGDRYYDVEGAAAWGLPTAGVTYGYGSAGELAQAGAAVLAAHPAEIGARLPARPGRS